MRGIIHRGSQLFVLRNSNGVYWVIVLCEGNYVVTQYTILHFLSAELKKKKKKDVITPVALFSRV